MKNTHLRDRMRKYVAGGEEETTRDALARCGTELLLHSPVECVRTKWRQYVRGRSEALKSIGFLSRRVEDLKAEERERSGGKKREERELLVTGLFCLDSSMPSSMRKNEKRSERNKERVSVQLLTEKLRGRWEMQRCW